MGYPEIPLRIGDVLVFKLSHFTDESVEPTFPVVATPETLDCGVMG